MKLFFPSKSVCFLIFFCILYTLQCSRSAHISSIFEEKIEFDIVIAFWKIICTTLNNYNLYDIEINTPFYSLLCSYQNMCWDYKESIDVQLSLMWKTAKCCITMFPFNFHVTDNTENFCCEEEKGYDPHINWM